MEIWYFSNLRFCNHQVIIYLFIFYVVIISQLVDVQVCLQILH